MGIIKRKTVNKAGFLKQYCGVFTPNTLFYFTSLNKSARVEKLAVASGPFFLGKGAV